MNTKETYTQEAVIKSQSNITTTKRGIFTIAQKDGKYYILVQNYIVSEKTFDTFKQAERYMNSKPWELIINVTSLTQKLIKENEKS